MSDPSGVDVDQMISEASQGQSPPAQSAQPDSDIDVNQMISEAKKGPTTATPITQDQNDYKNMPWSTVAKNAVSSIPHSAYEQGSAIVGAATHPGQTIGAIGQIIDGLQSKAASEMGHPQDPQVKAQRESAVDALGKAYAEKYGTMAGFKQALSTDPVGVMMDVSAVASGGELAAAKVAGFAGKASAVGDIAQKASDIAGTVSRATNPLDPMGVVSKNVGSMLGSKPSAPFDPNNTSHLDEIIRAQSKNDHANFQTAIGTMDPASAQKFTDVLQTKGVSPATVNEAYLAANGMDASRTMTTGEKAASPAATAVHEQMQVANEAKAGDVAKSIAGTTNGMGQVAPDPASISMALQDAMNRASTRTGSLYDAASAVPGKMGFSIAGRGMNALIDNNLTSNGHLPINAIGMVPEVYPKTIQAIKAINELGSQSVLQNGVRVPNPIQMDAPGIIATRKVLSGLRDGAQGSDINGVNQVLKAFDDRVSQMAPQHWVGGNGNDFVNKFQAARQSHASEMNTFYDPGKGNNQAIANAAKRLKDLGTSAGAEDHAAIGTSIGNALSKPTTGQQTYGNLSTALQNAGGMKPVDDYLLHDLIQTNNGAIAKTPEQISTQIEKSIPHQQALRNNPQAAGAIRSINVARRISSAKIRGSANEADMLHKGTSFLTKAAGRALALHVGSSYGPIGELAGLLGEEKLEHVLDKWHGGRGAKKEALGAPSAIKKSLGVGGVFSSSINPIKSVVARNINEVGNREQRASGGRIGHGHLVERLMSLSEKAKRSIKQDTKSILGQDDNVVAKALAVAGKSI